MSKCTDDCRKPTPAMAHCATCHRTFGGVGGFDAHRSNGFCLNPAHLGYVRTADVWRTPMDEETRGRLQAIRPRTKGDS